MLSNEQIAEIKKQVINQIDATFSADKKEFAKQQIQAMTNEQFEEFLRQNQLIQKEQNLQQKCIFCSIAKGEVKSYKIDENEDAVAVLEINPISKAHVLIIPKKHVSSEQIPESILTLTKKISQKIKEKFNPREVSLFSSTLFGHQVINILPIYKDENQNSERKPAKPEELLEIQNQLITGSQKNKKPQNKPDEPKELEVIKKSKPETLKDIKTPKRIP